MNDIHSLTESGFNRITEDILNANLVGFYFDGKLFVKWDDCYLVMHYDYDNNEPGECDCAPDIIKADELHDHFQTCEVGCEFIEFDTMGEIHGFFMQDNVDIPMSVEQFVAKMLDEQWVSHLKRKKEIL